MTRIKKLHTPCKDCCFADYEDNTQKSCLLGLVDLYRDTEHIEIIEAYDNDKEFYIINGKKCAGYREQKYFNSRQMQDSSMPEKIAYVKDRLKLKYLAIINCKNRTPKELLTVLEKIKQAEVKPEMVMLVISNDSNFSANDYYKDGLYKSQINCKWKIKGLADSDQDLITTAHQSINIGAEGCNFVLCVDTDYSKVDEIINTANDIVYKQFKRFIVISNESKDTIIFNKFVYQAALFAQSDIITDYGNYTIL